MSTNFLCNYYNYCNILSCGAIASSQLSVTNDVNGAPYTTIDRIVCIG